MDQALFLLLWTHCKCSINVPLSFDDAALGLFFAVGVATPWTSCSQSFHPQHLLLLFLGEGDRRGPRQGVAPLAPERALVSAVLAELSHPGHCLLSPAPRKRGWGGPAWWLLLMAIWVSAQGPERELQPWRGEVWK